MNILYINEDNYGGGASKALVIFAREMISLGHNVHVVSRKNDGFIINELQTLGAKLYLCNIYLPLYPNNPNPLKKLKGTIILIWRWYRVSALIDKIVCREKIDIVHANSGLLYQAFHICKKRKIPHISHHREFFDKFLESTNIYPNNKCFLKAIASPYNYNICITNSVFNYLKLEKNNRNCVIYDGIISKQYVPTYAEHKSKNYFLFAGRIQRNKAPHLAIMAFADFHKIHPNFKLYLAGLYNHTDPYYNECVHYINDYNLSEAVEFLGYRDDVNLLMREATAIIVPSVYEGFGFIMVEGMLNRTLLIGRNTTGTKEQFDLGLKQTGKEIGLRFSNKAELVKAMIYAVENDTTEMRELAYKVVCDNYTIKRCVKETENFYYMVLDDFKRNNKS